MIRNIAQPQTFNALMIMGVMTPALPRCIILLITVVRQDDRADLSWECFIVVSSIP